MAVSIELAQQLVKPRQILRMDGGEMFADLIQMISVFTGQLEDIGFVAQATGG
jgi:hypothetical protein